LTVNLLGKLVAFFPCHVAHRSKDEKKRGNPLLSVNQDVFTNPLRHRTRRHGNNGTNEMIP
jgi:hypothetical protein